MKKFWVYSLFSLFVFSQTVVLARSFLGTGIPLFGKTELPLDMQAVVLGYVYAKVSKTVSNCNEFLLTGTKVAEEKKNVVYRRNGKEIGGNWAEEWTVDACGTPVIVPVKFTTTKHGVKYDIQDVKYPQ